MKVLKCEICGSTELVKQDEFFVCQYCGAKYSPEEAKKMMIEGTVDVSGSTIKVDASEKLNNLYKLARRARDEDNSEDAEKYYSQISIEDPDSWEAQFYRVLFSCKNIKIAEMGSACVILANTIDNVFNLIKSNISDKYEQINCFLEVIVKSNEYGLFISKNILSYYKKNYGGAYSNAYLDGLDFLHEHQRGLVVLYEKLGDASKSVGLNDEACSLYKTSTIWFKAVDSNTKNVINSKIKELDPEYDANSNNSNSNISSSGGCYVATCVYGSYDCPQVWTLRRYRDEILSETWYGRAFIHTYYTVSPTLVKCFGHTKWFKYMWKGKLDRIVSDLNSKGFQDTPYIDKNW